ncbi:retrovirus-related pol polyprotein from transposon TNT 1-94 [Tanacetum coccineum]
MAGYKHNQLKNKSFDEIKKLFDKEKRRVNTFVPMDSEVVERKLKAVERKHLVRKEQIVPDDDSAVNVESLATKYPIVDWKTHILAEDKMYYQIIRADESTKYYKIFSAMLDDFDRQDMLDLYRLRLFDSCGVHLLLMSIGIAIHMLVEKKYPLTQEMLSRMLSRRLEVDHECEMAYELLRFIKSQHKKIKRHLSDVEVTAASYKVTVAGYSFYCWVQQGDPLGPLLFALVLHPLVHKIRDSCKLLLHAWYLDDGTIIEDSEELLGGAVSRDADFISGMALRRAVNVVDLMNLLP